MRAALVLCSLLLTGAACADTRGDVRLAQSGDASISELRPAPDRITQTSPKAAAQALNTWRQARGLSPLHRNPRLQQAAEVQSRDMARTGRMAHQGSDGSRVGDRAKRAGYTYSHVAENLAMTPFGIDSAMELWEKSPSHRQAMLRPDLRDFGLAQVGQYWTLVLGKPR